MADGARPIPEQQLPDRESLRLQRHLESIAAVLGRMLVERVIPLLPDLLPKPREDGSHLDQGDPLNDVLREIFVTFGQVLESQRNQAGISRVGRVVDRVNRGQVEKQFQFAIGLDISDTEPFVSGRVNDFVRSNVGLIRNMGAEEVAKVERLVLKAQQQGTRVEDVAAQIMERTGVIKRRAKVIARDQVNKLNAQLTKDRQTAVGVQRYRWRTSRDSRVRGSNGGTTFGPDSGATGHAALEGTIQRWDDPPVTNARGDKNHPGQDILCRCTAEPVLDEVLQRPQPAPIIPKPKTPKQAPEPNLRPLKVAGIGKRDQSILEQVAKGLLEQTINDAQTKSIRTLQSKGLVEASFRGGVRFRDIRLTSQGRAALGVDAPIAPPAPIVEPPPPVRVPVEPGRLSDRAFVESLQREEINTLGVWKSNSGYQRLRKVQAGRIKGSSSDLNHLQRIDEMASRAPRYTGRMYRGLERLDPDVAKALATEGAVMETESWTSFTTSARTLGEFSENVRGKVWVRYSVEVERTNVFDTRRALRQKQVASRSGIKANENEVLAPKGATFRVKSARPVRERGQLVGYKVTLEEA